MELIGFDATQQGDWQGSFEPLPPGRYLAIIVESQEKTNSKNTGSYLELKFQITEGEHAGRNVWQYLNIVNLSQNAARIAKAELAAICRAVDVLKPPRSADLHNIPLRIDLQVRKCDDDPDRKKNVIVGYHKQGVASAATSDTTPF